MRAWKELTAAALEGTAKAHATDEQPERRLLKEAGWHTLTRLAGRLPDRLAVTPPTTSPAEQRPVVSRPAASRLEEILRTDDREHLGEWLHIAAGAGKRVPTSFLPALLERAAENTGLRADTLTTGGARVSWLAAHNEEWAFADIADPGEAFKSGIRAARVAALGVLRQADPAAALNTLAESWPQEGGDDRAALVPVLAVGLGPGDEQFLTAATGDGRKEVRAAAAALLARLPMSALIGRMTARADTYLRFTKGMLGGKLEVSPPAECTDDMSKDGIEAKPPKGVGEKAHWLRQVIALVPPSHWPAEMFEPGVKSDWSEPLVDGWAEAAARFQDAKWCELLIDHMLGQKDRNKVLPRLHALARAAPAASIETLVQRYAQKEPLAALELATTFGERLSLRTSTDLLRSVQRVLGGRDQKQREYWLFTMTRQLRSRLDPAILPEVVALANSTGAAGKTGEALQALAATLEYRAEMAKEILN